MVLWDDDEEITLSQAVQKHARVKGNLKWIKVSEELEVTSGGVERTPVSCQAKYNRLRAKQNAEGNPAAVAAAVPARRTSPRKHRVPSPPLAKRKKPVKKLPTPQLASAEGNDVNRYKDLADNLKLENDKLRKAQLDNERAEKEAWKTLALAQRSSSTASAASTAALFFTSVLAGAASAALFVGAHV